jgi:hypothetical protein
MGNHQRSNSRTVLDQLFWAGTASPSQSGRAAPQVGLGAAAERREPKADTSEPGLAQEIPSVGSPAIQPILLENADVAAVTNANLNDERPGGIADLMDTLRVNLDKFGQQPVTVLVPQASLRPAEPAQVLDANNSMQPGEAAGQEAPQVDSSATADRHEPKADTGEPEPAQDIPSVSSPAIESILIESVADQQFRIELQEGLTDAVLNDKRRGEIAELMDTLRGNLDKIEQHGKRADALVKNMLLHSREGSGEHLAVDISAAVK